VSFVVAFFVIKGFLAIGDQAWLETLCLGIASRRLGFDQAISPFS